MGATTTKPVVLDDTQIAADETSEIKQNCVITVVFTIIYMTLSFVVILLVVFVSDLHTNMWAAFAVGLIAGLVLLCAVIHLLFALQRSRQGGCECA